GGDRSHARHQYPDRRYCGRLHRTDRQSAGGPGLGRWHRHPSQGTDPRTAHQCPDHPGTGGLLCRLVGKMKLLVVLSRMPYPLEKGDKLRAYHLVKRLAKRHDIYLFCLSDQPTRPADEAHLRGFCKHLQVVHIPRWRILLRMFTAFFSRLPFQVSYFHHRHAQRTMDRVIDEFRPDHVLCQLVRTTEYVRRRYNLGKTLDYMDTLSKGMERR